MSTFEKFKTIVILGLFAALGAMVVGKSTTAQKKRTQFEYHVRVGSLWSPSRSPSGVLSNGVDSKAELDQMGDEGWELVTIEAASEVNNQKVLYIFRRPK